MRKIQEYVVATVKVYDEPEEIQITKFTDKNIAKNFLNEQYIAAQYEISDNDYLVDSKVKKQMSYSVTTGVVECGSYYGKIFPLISGEEINLVFNQKPCTEWGIVQL